jgi:hypothetical protein
MLVRAKVTHFHNALRLEGDEFEYFGPLYEHIEPAEPETKRKPGRQVQNQGPGEE